MRKRVGVIAVCAAIAVAGVLPVRPGTAAAMSTWYGHASGTLDGDTMRVSFAESADPLVRFVGIQAMAGSESTYPRVECHALPAQRRLRNLTIGGERVRLTAQDPGSTGTRNRLLRFVAIRRNGAWHDIGAGMIRGGWVLWRASRKEPSHNLQYHRLAEAAARSGKRMWDRDNCGDGPQDYIPIRVKVHYDAKGDDARNLNGEWVRITNRHASQPLQLGGWWVRDAANRRYTFAAGTKLRPGRSLTVHVGRGSDTRRHLYWGRSIPVFVNPANDGRHMGDGAYLFDPDGDIRAHHMYPCVSNC